MFENSGVAIVTPFTHDKKINYDVFEELLAFHEAHNTDAIIVSGTTGEASTLSDDEKISLVEFAKKHCALPIIAGTGSNNTLKAKELSLRVQDAGADACLIVTPYYNKTSADGVFEHYNEICEGLDVPVVLYNIPSRTGLNMTPEVISKLAQIKNIVGIKEASGDIVQVAKISSMTNVNIYTANDNDILAVKALGGRGVISTLANILPQEVHDISANNNLKLQLRLLKLIDLLFCEVNPIPIKTALNFMGYDVGGYRLPLVPMTKQNATLLKNEMIALGIIKL